MLLVALIVLFLVTLADGRCLKDTGKWPAVLSFVAGTYRSLCRFTVTVVIITAVITTAVIIKAVIITVVFNTNLRQNEAHSARAESTHKGVNYSVRNT